MRDDLVKELDLLGERAATTAAVAAEIDAQGKNQAKKPRKTKFVRPVKVDDVCLIKKEIGHVIIKVCASFPTFATITYHFTVCMEETKELALMMFSFVS